MCCHGCSRVSGYVLPWMLARKWICVAMDSLHDGHGGGGNYDKCGGSDCKGYTGNEFYFC